jgi:hypothetical protein
LRNVTISNIVATGGELASSITGLPGHPVSDITLANINVTMAGGDQETRGLDVPENAGSYPEARMFGSLPAFGIYVRHAEGITLSNVRVASEKPDARPTAIFDDVKDLQLDGFRPEAGPTLALWLNDVSSALVRSSWPVSGGQGVIRISGAASREIHLSGSSFTPSLANGAAPTAVIQ